MPTTLGFHHAGPPLEAAIALPPLAIRPADHTLIYDPVRRALVYVTAPDYHQVGHAWTFDGARFTPISTTTYRLGSQDGRWTAVWDVARGAIVAWGFGSEGPYGVAIDDPLRVILHADGLESHTSMDQTAAPTVTTGPRPGANDAQTWENLYGIFGYDPTRRVTVCLAQDAIFELADTTWSRVAGAPELPTNVDGDRGAFAAGAGAVWDAQLGELVFWLHDGDEDVVIFGAWNGARWNPLPTAGLPTLWKGFGKSGFAVGDHPAHGVVVYAGPEHGLFGRTATGFAPIGGRGETAPPRGIGGQLAYDHARGVLVLGPFTIREGDQNVLHELRDDRWTRIGAATKAAPFRDLSSGFQAFARHRDGMFAAGMYLKTIAWDPAHGWRSVVDEKAGDAARDDGRAQAFATAWDGALHAVMNDGGVMVLGETTWTRKAPASAEWKDPAFPLVAFDPSRGILVGWGSHKKSGGRKNDTFVHDGTAWAKAKKAKAKPADLDNGDTDAFTLFYDPGKQMVARLGQTELAHFDGTTWIATALADGKLIETWRRCVCFDPASGVIVVVNCGQKVVVRIANGKVTKVGTFEPPAPRDRHDNLPFDRWWFDAGALAVIVHNDVDVAQTFALDLRAAFAP